MVVGVICSVSFFIVGVLVGVMATGMIHKCKKVSYKVQSTSETVQPPVYEEMESYQGKGQPQVKFQQPDTLQLEENVAYGHV